VSGHYDSRASRADDATADAPGANDDASGVAVVLELARLFAASPHEATIVFLCAGGEEQGLLGSRHFAKRAVDAGWRVEAMITNDIVGNSVGRRGRRDRGTVRVFSEGMPRRESPAAAAIRPVLGAESDSPSRQLARFVRERAAQAVPGIAARLVFRPDRFLRGGDHLAFNEVGVAAVRLTEPFEDFDRQHQDVRTEDGRSYGDVPDRVDFEYVARVTRVNAAALHALANAPPPPRGVRIHAARLENDTTLSWGAVDAPDLAHYEVVWRETTAPDWTHGRAVGAALQATLPLSKDDLHFGVRAVDRDGHKSPVAYPEPWRG
ncbi:MAG: M28 family metallopeptidase, partial [Planctomycetota bacterium]